jgi:transketolase
MGDSATIGPTPIEIQPPLDFHYIDDERVSAIYSEVEPDLIESKRTISNGSKTEVEGGVDAYAASLKAGASKSAQQATEYERSEFSVDRPGSTTNH